MDTIRQLPNYVRLLFGLLSDRRVATVTITDAGTSALEAAAPGHVKLVRSVLFDGLTAAQQRAFGSAIETVLARIRTGKPS